MATAKKTKKVSDKTTKATTTRKPRAKKTVVENADAMVDEFLNETTVSPEEPTNVKPTVEGTQQEQPLEKDPEREIVEIISNNIASEMEKEVVDTIVNGEAPDVEEIINSETEEITKTEEPVVEKVADEPKKKPEKPKKRLTNRDVFGYDFMGMIYDY